MESLDLAQLYERPDQLQLNVSGFACLVVVLIIVITSLLRHHMSFLVGPPEPRAGAGRCVLKAN